MDPSERQPRQDTATSGLKRPPSATDDGDAMSAISIDASAFPLVRIAIDGKQSDDEIETLLAEFEALLGRTPYYALVEIRDYQTNFDHVKRIASWTSTHLDLVRGSVAAAVLVIPSDLFRLMLSTFMLITPLPCPLQATTDVEEAIDWLEGHAREAGIELEV